MAKLYFRYAAMNAGKSSALLQVAHNYEERGQSVALFTAAIDTRSGHGRIASRLGLSRSAEVFTKETAFLELEEVRNLRWACLLLDEAQFLTDDQVHDLHFIAHYFDLPVICYGLRSDFQGKPFPGSTTLLAVADALEELKTICRCGRKASMTVRMDAFGNRVHDGDQIAIGGNDRYESVCPLMFYTGSCETTPLAA